MHGCQSRFHLHGESKFIGSFVFTGLSVGGEKSSYQQKKSMQEVVPDDEEIPRHLWYMRNLYWKREGRRGN